MLCQLKYKFQPFDWCSNYIILQAVYGIWLLEIIL